MHLQKSACESPSKMALNNTFFGLFEKKQPEKTLNSSKIPKKLKTAKVLSLEYQNGR